MDKKSIIEKIQKLLSLANSSNENEAKLAAQKATELLTKYNLSMQDVEVSKREYEALHYMGTTTRMTREQKYIFSILNKFFFIQVVRGRKFNYDERKFVQTWSFFGEQHNVQIAHYVHAFLDQTFHNLYKEYKKVNETTRASRNSFYMGIHRGIIEQLSVGKAKVEQEAGLVVVKDPGIDQFISDTVGKTRNIPTRRPTDVDPDAYHKGVEQGKNVRIAMGLDTGSTSSGKVLGGKV